MMQSSLSAPPATPRGALSHHTHQLFLEACGRLRNPRNRAYRAGVLAALRHRTEDEALDLPYRLGTAEADAWFAGTDEGAALWREAQGEG